MVASQPMSRSADVVHPQVIFHMNLFILDLKIINYFTFEDFFTVLHLDSKHLCF